MRWMLGVYQAQSSGSIYIHFTPNRSYGEGGGSRNIPIQVLLSDLKIKFLNSRFGSQSCSRDEGHAVWHGSPGRNSIAQPFPKLGSLGDVAGLMDGIAV